ncbi:unnamed protein product [Vitrella brassicaformis CCMP3155]|uniref:Clathrin/coatomer adaptor adaptin-like N-terminal domain-containing protein n=2 Tax=Vitrella brassicaformis TaxID=1169539 RepID=A0A0G4EP52_VITBC|nr:unnamed protein product [Vitrella brassicaformis CCMP3155]|mmetsp:Transcript_1329/g.2895  ORF Transcript_1329/g.2895 Transcript_1329/m.2895 type:complete len:802 (+) Transcript_1329:71-2476(+)|eukprot:CEL99404.1 unnamed protein product [Vitrella brassicaformis CCMP3155]
MFSTKSLHNLVRGLRAAKGDESQYISQCVEECKREARSKNLQVKSTAVLKLAYLQMLNYDMSWACFAVVEVMSHSKYTVKRPAYLACSIVFDDDTDVSLLTTNLFKKDLTSKEQFETGLALNCIACMASPEIARDLSPDLVGLLTSSRPYVRKKAVLCMYKVFYKYPPALRSSFGRLRERLGDDDQGVLTSVINTLLELARKNAKNYLSLVPQLYHILTNTTNNWLIIKMLKLFQLLCPLEPRLPPKLLEPLTLILTQTKAKSVEYEAIRLILRVMPSDIQLVKTAIDRLRNFVDSVDKNLRYLGFTLLSEVLAHASPSVRPAIGADAVNGTAGEEQPLQAAGSSDDSTSTRRHRKQVEALFPDLHQKVLEFVEDSDASLRSVALWLLNEIATPQTFPDIVRRLLRFTRQNPASQDFLRSILAMGKKSNYELVGDYAWYLVVLADIAKNRTTSPASHHHFAASSAVKSPAEEVAHQLIDVAVRVPSVRKYAVQLGCLMIDASDLSGDAVHGMLQAAQDHPLHDADDGREGQGPTQPQHLDGIVADSQPPIPEGAPPSDDLIDLPPVSEAFVSYGNIAISARSGSSTLLAPPSAPAPSASSLSVDHGRDPPLPRKRRDNEHPRVKPPNTGGLALVEGKSLGIAPSVVGASAWMLGEFHRHLDPNGSTRSFNEAFTSLLDIASCPTQLPPQVQQLCLWSALKVLTGATRGDTQTEINEYIKLRALIERHLPSFISSPHVEVSERSAFAYFLVDYFSGDAEGLRTTACLQHDDLYPVDTRDQPKVSASEGLDLRTPFFTTAAAS